MAKQELISLLIQSPARRHRAAFTALVLLSLTGCVPTTPVLPDRHGGFELPTSASEIESCPTDETILAEDLAEAENDCDRAGWTVVFPNKAEVVVSKIGYTRTFSSVDRDLKTNGTYTLVNLGALGLIAAHRNPDQTSDWWGPTDTLEDWWAAEGKGAPSDF